ncbi:uncharacterized protein LOC135394318 [Ornithodoros turicata]|uniref:uncharacterized protein LOC135394318 n=1 Tax=Ornithodoros turicata TaxID=34597 RepID=UPI003138B858
MNHVESLTTRCLPSFLSLAYSLFHFDQPRLFYREMLPLPGQWLAVVEFLGEKTTSAVPCSWLEEGHRRCRWPTKVTDKRREEMVQRNVPPGPWRLFAVRVLGYADSYTEAQNKVVKSLETSALESELSDSDSASPAQGSPLSGSTDQATVSLSQPAVESQCPSALGLHSHAVILASLGPCFHCHCRQRHCQELSRKQLSLHLMIDMDTCGRYTKLLWSSKKTSEISGTSYLTLRQQ